MRIIIIAIFILFITGCYQYTAVKHEQQAIKSIVVTPAAEWNQVPSSFSTAGMTTWTIDGESLNSLSFISEISDGETLISNSNDKEYPVFKSDMLPTELAELFESTIAIAYSAKITQAGSLKPLKIGGNQGFEYDFEFVAGDELSRKGYIAATIKEEKLHLIFYQAPKLHYFDNDFHSVKNLVRNAAIK